MDSPSWQPCSGDGLEAGMLAEPGPMDEPTIAGVHLRLTQAFPAPCRLTPCSPERNFESLGGGVSVMSLFCRFWVDEGRCMASLGSSGHAKPKEMT